MKKYIKDNIVFTLNNIKKENPVSGMTYILFMLILSITIMPGLLLENCL